MARSHVPSLFGGAATDPFQALQQFNRMFEDVFRGSMQPSPGLFGGAATAPRLNISETDQEFRIEAELPGVPEDKVELSLSDDILTIRGEKKAERTEEKESYHLMERAYGSFTRSIRLPFAVNPDDVSASCENGVLKITIPKSSAQTKSHRIEIGKGGTGATGAQPTAQGPQVTH